MTNIDNTIHGIIASANNFTHVKEDIYEDPEGFRFIVSRYGFESVDLYSPRFLGVHVAQMKGELDKKQNKILKLQQRIDELMNPLREFEP